MDNKTQYNINISLPNLMNICVDEVIGGEIRGRLYHCYSKDPVVFYNIIELLMEAENLFDTINYPQASTRTRCFNEREMRPPAPRPEKQLDQREILQYRGRKASLAVGIRFRQGSTWQGEFVTMENGTRKMFSNTLDFLKLMDHELMAL